MTDQTKSLDRRSFLKVGATGYGWLRGQIRGLGDFAKAKQEKRPLAKKGIHRNILHG